MAKTTGKRVAMVRVEAAETSGDEGAPLDAAGRRLVAEALRQAELARDAMEDSLVQFGRWLLVQVFDNDAGAALRDRHRNAVWRDLLARAGGPTLKLSERMLYVSLHIAAHDKRITDESWQRLEPGRKELLLVLGDEATMRKAAKHVTSLKLTQRATRQYVSALITARDGEREVRVTAPRLAARVRRFREGVTDAAFQRRSIAVLKGADAGEARAVRREVEAVKAWAERMLAKLDER